MGRGDLKKIIPLLLLCSTSCLAQTREANSYHQTTAADYLDMNWPGNKVYSAYELNPQDLAAFEAASYNEWIERQLVLFCMLMVALIALVICLIGGKIPPDREG